MSRDLDKNAWNRRKVDQFFSFQISKIREVEILLKVCKKSLDFWIYTNLEAVHASLQGSDGINFSYVHDTANGLET